MPRFSINKTVRDITYNQKHRQQLFLDLEPNRQVRVLLRLSKHVQKQLVQKLPNDVLLPILEKLDPDYTTDLLQLLPEKKQQSLIEKMGSELQKTVSLLLEFDPKTAAGLMSLNFVLVEHNEKLADVIAEVDRHEKRTGKVPTVLVVEGTELLGFIPLQRLLSTKPSDKAGDFVNKVRKIRHNASTDSVVEEFLNHPHKKIVVLGEHDNVLGILYSDDIIRVLQEKEISSLYDFAGLSDEESVEDSVRLKVKRRYKWLIINLGTAFFAAFTIGLFEDIISKYVLLAVYMPIVAGMGGNAGTQTLAILVRGISQNQTTLAEALPILKRELGAGFINGLINGLIVFSIVMLINRDPGVAIVLASAMIVNLLVASFFGTLIPLVMKRLGNDPATSATIFITTATDVLGFLAFLGLATLVLN